MTSLSLAGALLSAVPVAPAQAATVVKPVHIGDTGAFSRTRSLSTTAVTIAAQNGTASWTLNPTTSSAMTLAAGTIDVYISATCNGNPRARSYTVTLSYSGGSNGTIGTSATQNITPANPCASNYVLTGPIAFTLASDLVLNANTALILTVTNTTATAGRSLLVRPSDGVTPLTRVEYDVNDPLTVTSVDFYDAAYPGGSLNSTVGAGLTTYVRAVVSDAFGGYDVSPAGGTDSTITITGPSATGVTDATMGAAVATAAGNKTFEYAYTTTGSQTAGTYTATVTGYEGVEGTVTATGANNYTLVYPNLSVVKASTPTTDPVNLTVNPKRIPGATVVYRLTVENLSGPVAQDVLITDVLPAGVNYSTGSLAVSVDQSCTTLGDNTARTDATDVETGHDASYNSGTSTFTFGDTGTDVAAGSSVTFCYSVTIP